TVQQAGAGLYKVFGLLDVQTTIDEPDDPVELPDSGALEVSRVSFAYGSRDGEVRCGGVDLRHASLRSLRERIVVVPQEGFLFAGTVRDNIRIGKPDATDAEIEAAVDALDLRERFEELPEGLDTEVRERGSRLSAGERQLVSLVRAALADPTVLVLDEATSNLDPGTERTVERALEQLTEGRTVVVVA